MVFHGKPFRTMYCIDGLDGYDGYDCIDEDTSHPSQSMASIPFKYQDHQKGSTRPKRRIVSCDDLWRLSVAGGSGNGRMTVE